MRVLLVCLLVAACGGGGGGTNDDAPGDDVPGDDEPPADAAPPGSLRDRQRQLAIDLRGAPAFMVGLGNDNSGPYEHDVAIDLHYAYLVGYGDNGGWPTWNEDGNYALYFAQTATEHAVTPMFTYYQLALELEGGNDAVLNDVGRMHQYLADVRLMFQRIADHGQPAAVQFEPDFFGYLMHRAGMGTPPDELPARVHYADAPECAALPETAAGLVRCVIAIGRAVAPRARIALHASMWGAWYDVLDPNADIEASGTAVGDFLASVGGEEADFVTVETLDRDAGFWETSGGGPTCSITGGSRGPVYWDEDDVDLPNGRQHLRWVTALTARLNRPALEWQTPLGRPSDTCGGSDQAWRDNRVQYFFAHVPELAAAGLAGMTFGTGAGGQTNLATDGDQFKTAAAAYRADPFDL
jgi:hypothetical protein